MVGHFVADWPELWLLSTAHKIMVNCQKPFGYLGEPIFKYPLKVNDLGAVIGTEENKKNYINDKISEWTKGIIMLTDIATTHLQAAYTAYVTSYQNKLTYLLRTILSIDDQLKKIDEVVRHKLMLRE